MDGRCLHVKRRSYMCCRKDLAWTGNPLISIMNKDLSRAGVPLDD
ncbi:hypothetical protein F383_15599 [Gossypium arboreum]|uniref:Uncharacterized protein n=1 Tax=Gossypium arboreum TaxID=29729 RepID=A0A0B0NAU1_GOSAR|nr:hypothetical protein F383_15599 [Gossypium arboreum]